MPEHRLQVSFENDDWPTRIGPISDFLRVQGWTELARERSRAGLDAVFGRVTGAKPFVPLIEQAIRRRFPELENLCVRSVEADPEPREPPPDRSGAERRS